jgi:hypothetical protein
VRRVSAVDPTRALGHVATGVVPTDRADPVCVFNVVERPAATPEFILPTRRPAAQSLVPPEDGASPAGQERRATWADGDRLGSSRWLDETRGIRGLSVVPQSLPL